MDIDEFLNGQIALDDNGQDIDSFLNNSPSLAVPDIPDIDSYLTGVQNDIDLQTPTEKRGIINSSGQFLGNVAEGAVATVQRIINPDIDQEDTFDIVGGEDRTVNQIGQGLGQFAPIAGAAAAGGAAGAALTAPIGGIGAIPGSIIGGLVASLRLGQSELSQVEKDVRSGLAEQGIQDESLIQQRVDDARFKALPGVLLDSGVDVALIAARPALAVAKAIGAGAKGGGTAAKASLEASAKAAEVNVLQGLTQLGKIKHVLKGGSLAAAAEGVTEAVQSGSSRAAVNDALNPELNFASEVINETISKEGLDDFIVGAAVGGIVKGGINTAQLKGQKKAEDLENKLNINIEDNHLQEEGIRTVFSAGQDPLDIPTISIKKALYDIQDPSTKREEVVIDSTVATPEHMQTIIDGDKDLAGKYEVGVDEKSGRTIVSGIPEETQSIEESKKIIEELQAKETELRKTFSSNKGQITKNENKIKDVQERSKQNNKLLKSATKIQADLDTQLDEINSPEEGGATDVKIAALTSEKRKIQNQMKDTVGKKREKFQAKLDEVQAEIDIFTGEDFAGQNAREKQILTDSVANRKTLDELTKERESLDKEVELNKERKLKVSSLQRQNESLISSDPEAKRQGRVQVIQENIQRRIDGVSVREEANRSSFTRSNVLPHEADTKTKTEFLREKENNPPKATNLDIHADLAQDIDPTYAESDSFNKNKTLLDEVRAQRPENKQEGSTTNDSNKNILKTLRELNPSSFKNQFNRNFRRGQDLVTGDNAESLSAAQNKARAEARMDADNRLAVILGENLKKAAKEDGFKISDFKGAMDFTKSDVMKYPPKTRNALTRLRTVIDRNSRTIDDLVVADPESMLSAIIDSRIGAHYTRTYQFFDNDKYRARFLGTNAHNDPQIHAKLDNLRRMFERDIVESNLDKDGNLTLSPEEVAKRADSITKEYVVEALTSKNLETLLNPNIGGSRIKKTTGAILKKRKELPEEIRAFLGEELDIDRQFLKTAQKQATLIHQHRFLEELLEQTEGKTIGGFEPDVEKGFTETISPDEENIALSPLAGRYMTPSQKAALNLAFQPIGQFGVLGSIFAGFNAATKTSLTVLSPVTQVRNVMSNVLFMAAGGYYPDNTSLNDLLTDWKTAMGLPEFTLEDSNTQDRGKLENEQRAQLEAYLDSELKFLQDEGLVTGFGSKELMSLLEDSRLGVIGENAGKGVSSLIEVINDKAGLRFDPQNNTIADTLKSGARIPFRTYAAGDGLFKIIAYRKGLKRLNEIYADHPDFHTPEFQKNLSKAAVRKAKNNLPVYETLPRAVQALRSNPLVSPFVAFPASVLYTTADSYLESYQMSKGTHPLLPDSPKLRTQGRQELAIRTAVMASVAGAAEATAKTLGYEEEELESLNSIVPSWDKNGSNVPIGHTENGDPQYLAGDTVNPWGSMTTPIRILMKSLDEDNEGKNSVPDAIWESFKHFMDPFWSMEILTKSAMEVALNRSKNRDVYHESDGDFNKFSKSIGHIWDESLDPSRQAGNFVNDWKLAITGESKPSGSEVSMRQMGLKSMGLRVSTINRDQTAFFSAARFNTNTRDANNIFTRLLKQKGPVKDADLKEAFDEAAKLRSQSEDVFYEKVAALRNLRVPLPDDEIKEAIKRGGVATKNLEKVIAGESIPYTLSKNMIQKAEAIPGRLEQLKKVVPELFKEEEDGEE